MVKNKFLSQFKKNKLFYTDNLFFFSIFAKYYIFKYIIINYMHYLTTYLSIYLINNQF